MSNRTLSADMNVTPFLDILLVMIITFLAAMQVRMTMDAAGVRVISIPPSANFP